jgi:hypothetical protein
MDMFAEWLRSKSLKMTKLTPIIPLRHFNLVPFAIQNARILANFEKKSPNQVVAVVSTVEMRQTVVVL